MSATRQPLTPDALQAALDMAGDREVLLDQQQRFWGRWRAWVPECGANCAKCGRRITEGFCLLPEANIKICARHFKRWA